MSTTSLRNTDLDHAVATAREAYVAANPASLARHVEAAVALPGGNTRTVLHYAPFPLGFAGGQGCRLTDLDGHRYDDFLGEYTAGLYGHSHPVIRAAIDAALDGGISLGGHSRLEVRFAQAVCGRFPTLERVRFTNSGTEANTMALVTAAALTGRRRVMVFEGGYHGGVLTFARRPDGSCGSPINLPFDFVVAPYNDPEAAEALAREADLAAIIVEPMQGSGGCIPAEPAFLAALRAIADASGALLIFDEVMTSRLAPGGLHAASGVRPDLMTLGKYVGGGMSFGAFGGRADIMDRYDPRLPDALPHAGTFNNNVLTMAAGLAGLTEVFTPEAARALNARGDRLRERLNALFAETAAPFQATGIGSMLTLHATTERIRSVREAGGEQRLRELLFFDLLAAGIWTARRGMLALMLPLGDAECERFVAVVEDFLALRRPLFS